MMSDLSLRDSMLDIVGEYQRKTDKLREQIAWHPIDEADKYGPPVRLFDPAIMNEEFNPNGSADGHWCDIQGWIGAVWEADHDRFVTRKLQPTHWMALPDKPRRGPQGLHRLTHRRNG